jgi:hypothetical protein
MDVLLTDDSEEHVSSIFRVEEIIRAGISVRLLLTYYNKPTRSHIPQDGVLYSLHVIKRMQIFLVLVEHKCDDGV